MPQDTQPEFELPPRLRLPQVPPLKVPARRQTQFIARPSPVRSTEEVPVTPPLAPETDLFIPVPITPPLTGQPQAWLRASDRVVDREDIKTSILPVEKLADCRDAMNNVRSAPAPAWGERYSSRPYSQPYGWKYGTTHTPVRGFIPTGRRSREIGNGEFLLGCAFLIFMGLLAMGLLTWLSAAR